MSTAAEPRWPAWFGPVALALGLIAGIVGGVIAVIVIQGGKTAGNTLTPLETDVATVIQDLAFACVAIFLASRVAPVRPRQFGLRLPRSRARAAGVAIGVLLAFYAISVLWFALVNSSGKETEFVKEIGGRDGTLAVLGVCALTTVLAPICEELLFRGFIFRSLSSWRGPWPAALVTGLLFGGVHGLSAPAVDLLPLAVLGVGLCAVYQWTGSLYPCIAMHAVNNAIALGGDENWAWRTVELAVGALAVVALLLWCVRLASARWEPATD